MKKRYKYSILAILCVMFTSVAFFLFRVMEKFHVFSGSSSNSQDYEVQTDNYLSPSLNAKIKNIRKPIFTTSGFESLASNYERACYNAIRSTADKITNEKTANGFYTITPVTISGCKLSASQIKKVMYAIQNDNPDIFWISNTFSYQYRGSDTVIKINSVFSANEQKTALKILNDKVNQILEKIPFNASEYIAELFVHDYLVNNCKYQRTQMNNVDDPKIFTSYGCLVENVAVCEGFAKSFQLLLNAAGIKCLPVTGARGNEPHMWNIVKIDEKWYHVDVTWNASGHMQRYNYFNVTDAIIKKDHSINAQIIQNNKFNDDKRGNFKLPQCNSKDANYYEKNAIKASLLDGSLDNSITKTLINTATKQQEFIYIMAAGNLNLNDIKNYLIAQKPYKLFACINAANKSLKQNHLINAKHVKYLECSNQKTLIIQLIYNQ